MSRGIERTAPGGGRRPSRALIAAATALGLATAVPGQEPPAEGGLELAPIPVSVLAVPFPETGSSQAFVPVLVEVGGPELVAGGMGGEVRGEIDGVAFDAAGNAAGSFRQPFALSGEQAASEPLRTTGLKLYAAMRLAPGTYELAVTVRNTLTGASGEARSALPVPAFAAAGGPTAAPPLFAEPFERWRVFRQSQGLEGEPPYPFQGAEGGAFLPAAVPVLPRGGEVRFHLATYGIGEPPGALEVRLRGAGSAEAGGQAEVLSQRPGEFPGQAWLLARWELPPLAPGSYEFRVRAPGGAFPEVGARVLVSEGAAGPAVGADLPAPAVEPEEPESITLAGDLTPGEVEGRYREALDALAAGEESRAVAILATLELSATSGRRLGELKALRQAQEEVLAELARRTAHSLVPVLYLHYLADAAYVRRRDAWMAAHNRLFVEELVRRYAREHPPGARLGAQVLATLGSFGAAVDLDPENELALLRLGMAAEKSFRLKEAILHFRRLLVSHPGSQHGALRLALCLRRAGETGEAKGLLEDLVGGEAPPWLAALAFQELAAMEYERGQARRAEALLRRAVAAVGTQSLYLQLAFYLDHQGRPWEAVEVLNQMRVGGVPVGPSPRYRYNGEPESEVADAREEIRAAVEERLATFRAALRTRGGEVGGRLGGRR